MNIRELEQRLIEEGCNRGSFAIGARGSASDAYCLTRNGREWQVYYTERGVNQAPIYTSADEAQACRYFYDFMMSIPHNHCVGVFLSRALAEELQAKLEGLGLHPFQNNIPVPVLKEPLYRVWVSGKEIFVVKEALGAVYFTDQPQKKEQT